MVLFKIVGEVAIDKLSVDVAGLKVNLFCLLGVVAADTLPVRPGSVTSAGKLPVRPVSVTAPVFNYD